MLDQFRNKKGFTLIEIVIVIVIIAILAAVLVPSLTSWVDKAKISTIQEATGQIRSSLMTQLYEKSKTAVVTNTDQDNEIYDEDFWNEISERANTKLNADNLEFSVGDEISIIEIKYESAGHTASYDYENNKWTVE